MSDESGKYASGETPMVGDVILRVDPGGLGNTKVGKEYEVVRLDAYGDPRTSLDCGWANRAGRYRLVRRKRDLSQIDGEGVFHSAEIHSRELSEKMIEKDGQESVAAGKPPTKAEHRYPRRFRWRGDIAPRYVEQIAPHEACVSLFGNAKSWLRSDPDSLVECGELVETFDHHDADKIATLERENADFRNEVASLGQLLSDEKAANAEYCKLLKETAGLESKLEATKNERDEAVALASKQALLRGLAEGKLKASEMAGVVEGWRDRAERAERELKELKSAAAARICESGECCEKLRAELDATKKELGELRKLTAIPFITDVSEPWRLELFRQHSEAWMRQDFRTADRIAAALIGEPLPSERELKELKSAAAARICESGEQREQRTRD